MLEALFYSIPVAFLAAFSILLITTTGLRDEMIIYAPKLISKAIQCDFCLSFWMCSIVSIVPIITTGNYYMFFMPFIATPLTRKLI